MITKTYTLAELKELATQTLLNKTDKVSKISDNSVLNAMMYSIAKVGSKAMKEISLVDIHLFPEGAYGEYLDKVATYLGISDRFGSLPSTTYLRIVADVGTTYTTSNIFTSSSGVQFILDEDVIIGSSGYTYAKVTANEEGEKTNVEPLSITKVSPEPTGHIQVMNEYYAQNGRDEESDILFRKRILSGANLSAQGTLSKLTQAFQKINENVLRILYTGVTSQGRYILSVLTQNGADLTQAEIDELKEKAEEYMSLSEIRPYGVSGELNLEITNVNYYTYSVDFRVQIDGNYDEENIRKEIQIKMSKLFDFRLWEDGDKIEWDELLQVVKDTTGVLYVPDVYFTPGADLQVPTGFFPRINSFTMRNLNGDVLSSGSGVSPVYFPNEPNESYQQTILASI